MMITRPDGDNDLAILTTTTAFTVDLVIFEGFIFRECREEDKFANSRISRKIIFIIAQLEKNANSRILNFVKSHKIRNSWKFKHAKVTRFTVWHIRHKLFSSDIVVKIA